MTWQFWIAPACDVVIVFILLRPSGRLRDAHEAIDGLLLERRTLLWENEDLRTRLIEEAKLAQ
ncbi:MAG: hypothetical protein ABFD89_17475 [Bryobacteraceae bacterium]